MPYTTDSPPDAVKNQSAGVQRTFIAAFNSAYHKAINSGASEEEADTSGRAAGWSAVKAKYRRITRNGEAKYVPKAG